MNVEGGGKMVEGGWEREKGINKIGGGGVFALIWKGFFAAKI
jgi:hypothetical protein